MVICMLAAYLVWHLRNEWAPLTFAYEHQPDLTDSVAPAKHSTAAERTASSRTEADGEPVRSFTTLLEYLAMLTRNDIRDGTDPHTPTTPILSTPTTIQRRTFELISCPLPIRLKYAERPPRNPRNPRNHRDHTLHNQGNFGLNQSRPQGDP